MMQLTFDLLNREWLVWLPLFQGTLMNVFSFCLKFWSLHEIDRWEILLYGPLA